MVIDIIRRDALPELIAIPKKLIEKGKPDSIWQMLILYGALQVKPLTGHFITYQVQTYFGMLAATYE
jgi:aromatic ring-opening dioxygenase LigB subunit